MAGRWASDGYSLTWTLVLGLTVINSVCPAKDEAVLTNCTAKYQPNLQCEVLESLMCPRLEKEPQKWPAPPTDFTVGTFVDEILMAVKNKTGKRVFVMPGLKFTWKLPQHSGAEMITGFEVSLLYTGGKFLGRKLCLTFNLTGTVTDLTTVFEYKLFPVAYRTKILILLYSLPKPHPDFDKWNYVTQEVKTPSFLYKDHLVTADWVFGMNKANDSCKRQVTCSFTVPPPELNITVVDVHLLEIGEKDYTDTVRVHLPKHVAAFEDVEPGSYELRLEIVDEHYNSVDHCLCRNSQGECYRCMMTTSDTFTIEHNHSDCPVTGMPPVRTTPDWTSVSVEVSPGAPTTMKDVTRLKNVIGSVTGVLAAVLLIIVLVFIVQKYDLKCWGKPHLYEVDPNKPPPSFSPENINNNTTKAIPMLRQRVIYLVYTDDHSYHQRAVKLLAKYLKKYCKCDVRYPAWCLQEIQTRGTITWVLQMIQEADYVIVINSEGAFKMNQARKDSSTPCKFNDSPIGDIFTPAITNIIANFYKNKDYKKYIMVQFHYTDDKFQISEISPGYGYVLMKHFRELICHIHEINTENHDLTLSVCLPLQPDAHAQTEEGRELLQEINAAQAFTKAFPNWFEDMYVTDEDCFDSGMSSLPVDSFPDHLREQIQRECVQNLLRYPPPTGDLIFNTDLSTDLETLHLPQRNDCDARSITQSQVTYDPPVDLYSVSTSDLGLRGHPSSYETIDHLGGHPLAGLGGGGDLKEHCGGLHGVHSAESCLRDSGRTSQGSGFSQPYSHTGPFNISTETASFIPPADDDSVLDNPYTGYHRVHCDSGQVLKEKGTADIPPLILSDNLSWDAMSV
ncbi:uncharacterized protein LOC135471954 [Liolophura sinensis]|uniref:uncharacterized protein LOC135471954 n=1 Tax=Liolophura sinensis TaxID=3198878 RepID=UPI00315843A6